MKKEKYPKEYWEELIEEYKGSGLHMKEFCSIKEVSVTALKYHMYHKPEKKELPDDDTSPDEIEFVPVSLKQEEPVTDSSVVIRLQGNASISVDHSTDLLLLKKILEALS